ncbi:hypothetical protein ACLX1H_009470 [Fusarium chlamydosporum]
MDSEETLVIFKSGGGGYDEVGAYLAEIPTKNLCKSLLLDGPIYIQNATFPRQAGTPIFDYGKDRIFWAVANDGDHKIRLWRMDAHFSLVSSQIIPIEMTHDTPPYVMHDGETLVVGFFTGVGDELALSRRSGQDKKWTALPFNSRAASRIQDEFGKHVIFYNPPANTALQYIFCLRPSRDGVGINTIRKESLGELPDDNTIQWHWTFGQLEYPAVKPNEGSYAPIILHDKTTRKNRLYIFSLVDGKSLFYSFFPLRQDGSMDTYERKTTAQDVQKLEIEPVFTGSKIKVHQANQQIILLVETQRNDHPLVGYSGWVGDDGSPPVPTLWQKIDIKFQSKADAGGRVFESIVIPSSWK